MAETVLNGPQGQALACRKIASLVTDLIEWRANHEIKDVTRDGGVFEFVKGLRLSARLIYIIRPRLSAYDLEVNWGQIVDDRGVHLSPECDVIIHRPGYVDRWNGEGDASNVMDFWFVELSKVLAVISCKSYLTSFRETDRKYCEKLKKYLKRAENLWLFAECVPRGKEKKLSKDAKSIGHNKFWYLYSWDEQNWQPQEDRTLWVKFLKEIDEVGKRASKRG